MCSEYHTKTSPKEVEEVLGQYLINNAKSFNWGERVGFYKNGPVIEKSGDEYELNLKSFPSSPMPNARLSGLGGQTDGNSPDSDESEHRQIKRIYETPRWKKGFHLHPVLVPMSSFTEFAYWGKNIGTAQEYKVPSGDPLLVAGFLFKPFKPAGEETDAFALITHTATAQMLHDHHRLITILQPDCALGYLEEMEPEERFLYLIENRYTGELESSTVRKMAKGWEKRVDIQKSKLDRELQYRTALKKEGVPG